jgi:hypothetical protein
MSGTFIDAGGSARRSAAARQGANRGIKSFAAPLHYLDTIRRPARLSRCTHRPDCENGFGGRGVGSVADGVQVLFRHPMTMDAAGVLGALGTSAYWIVMSRGRRPKLKPPRLLRRRVSPTPSSGPRSNTKAARRGATLVRSSTSFARCSTSSRASASSRRRPISVGRRSTGLSRTRRLGRQFWRLCLGENRSICP